MKNFKFLLPLFALVFAFGLSAFTAKKDDSSSVNVLHWFNVDTGDYLGEISAGDAENITNCFEQSQPDCARGYSEEQLANPEDPESGPAASMVFTQYLSKN